MKHPKLNKHTQIYVELESGKIITLSRYTPKVAKKYDTTNKNNTTTEKYLNSKNR